MKKNICSKINLIIIMKYICAILIFLLSNLMINNINSQERYCECKLEYSVNGNFFDYLQNVIRNEEAKDSLDICDYRCIDWCANEIVQTINKNASFSEITEIGQENICETVFPNKSLVKDGIVVSGAWDLEGCAKSDDQESVILQEKLCCRYCKCQLAYINAKSVETKLEIDFSSIIYEKQKKRAFKCEELNHLDECEKDCRELVAQKLDLKYIQEISSDQYDPLKNRFDSNKICKILNRKINNPGINLMIRYELGPRNESQHKDIHLGNICCQRTCNCEIIYKLKNKNITTEDCKLDISSRMPVRPVSYYCADELKECIDDCKIAAGLTFRNKPIQSTDISPLDIDIFSEFTTARKACVIYNRDALRTKGVEIYLRYSTGNGEKRLYPV